MSSKKSIYFTKLKCGKSKKPRSGTPGCALNTEIRAERFRSSGIQENLAKEVETKDKEEGSLSSVTRNKLHNFALRKDNLKSIDSLKSGLLYPEDGHTTAPNICSQPANRTIDEQLCTSQIKFTPLEKQYLEIKAQYPDAVLFVECGYKYRFFGEDAKIASQHLNICCNFEQHMFSASIPSHRLNVHVRRLVALGYKVGVVKQTESSALKSLSENRNELFDRKLSALYTRATLIGQDVDNSEESMDQDGGCSPYMVCIFEHQNSAPRNTANIGIVGLCPTTGDACYWWSQEATDRKGLERCLAHIQPVEILMPTSSLSVVTTALVNHFIKTRLYAGEHVRVETLEESCFDYASGLINLTDLFQNGSQEMSKLAPEVVCATSALLTYLEGFHLKGILKSSEQLVPMVKSESTLYLSTESMRNLELFHNSSNMKEHGSLFWAINKSKTSFGRRLLKNWLSNPLCSECAIKERQDIVEEILHSESAILKDVSKMLLHLPDLETGICSTLQLRVSCEKFYNLVHHLDEILSTMCRVQDRAQSEIKVDAFRHIFQRIPFLLRSIHKLYNNLNSEAAKSSDVTTLLTDVSMYTNVVECRNEIASNETKLNEEKMYLARLLKVSNFNYTTVGNHEYLIEVKNSLLSEIPPSWMKFSGTKQVSRFRSPEVDTLFKTLCVLREKHKLACQQAWHLVLMEFNEHFFSYKEAVHLLANLDCYFSLAEFAKQEGFCRPKILPRQSKRIKIVDGRHPVLEKILTGDQQYVANSTDLSASKLCMILTGPNMGGKSSYLRQVALITLLAHVGAHVPALEAEISILDAIYTRMGAKDQILEYRSTFMVEMQETSDILQRATQYSFVILDELGRGTSTHDGNAIAYTTLHHLISKVRCLTLFVTHYLPVTELETSLGYPINSHMSFVLDNDGEIAEILNEACSNSSLTFLYKLEEGIAKSSYGMNVGRLAGLPPLVLKAACHWSSLMLSTAQANKLRHQWFERLFKDNDISVIKQFIKE